MNPSRYLLILAVLVATPMQPVAAEPTLSKTPRSTWSEHGYQHVRFGMGPGDVAEVLRQKGGSLASERPLAYRTGEDGSFVISVFGQKMGAQGDRIRGELTFFKRGLGRVTLLVVDRFDEPVAEAPVFLSVTLETMTERYGEPKSKTPAMTIWEKGDLMVAVAPRPPAITFFSSSAWERHLEDIGNEVDAKRREARPGTPSSGATSPHGTP